jgi:ABC-type taurine transport system substrate-binding protein
MSFGTLKILMGMFNYVCLLFFGAFQSGLSSLFFKHIIRCLMSVTNYAKVVALKHFSIFNGQKNVLNLRRR